MRIYKYLILYYIIIIFTSIFQPAYTLSYLESPPNKQVFNDGKLGDFTYKNSIYTVQLSREGWPLSYPILDIKDQIPLLLSFDELDEDPQNYSYTLIHCNADWEPSNILQNDYLEGMHNEIIKDYEFSRNSLQSYVHYELRIPNEDVKPIISGNYIVKVYENYNEENVVLTRRFFLVDHLVSISGEAKRTNNLNFFDSHQEIDFTIQHERIRLDDPNKNIQVVIVQNFDFETSVSELHPTFITPGELVYDYEEENIFPGISENRHFDTKNLKIVTEGIDFIRFERPLNHVYLLPDATRSIGDYIYEEDLNGKFFIKWDEGFDADTDADYAYVHFSLPFDAPLTEGSVSLFGGLTDWSDNMRYELNYNYDSKSYEISTLLKQGYYNYQYRFKPERAPVDPSFFEGAFFETENDFLIFVYYQDFSLRYQQLVGFEIFNTINKNND